MLVDADAAAVKLPAADQVLLSLKQQTGDVQEVGGGIKHDEHLARR
jgi:phosphoribosylformimino-5-aminoimidazole carboxamide ribonucleotide (ProFAR) isomerase